MQVDYLIVGQGLAGSVTALLLQARGRSVAFADRPDLSRCSRVAAGLYNPVTGRRMVLAPDFGAKWARAETLYRDAEAALGRPLLHPRFTLRLFRNAEEREAWEKRRDDPAYRAYLGEAFSPDEIPDSLRGEWGGCEIRGTGHLDVPALLDGVRARFPVIEERFDPSDCALGPHGVRWRDIAAERLLLCEGHLGADNPWFPDAGFEPARGEIIDLRIPGLAKDRIVIKGSWLLPAGSDWFRAGSTYHWSGLQDRPGPDAAAQLEQAVRAITPLPIAERGALYAGVRPSTRTREPICRRHPEHARVAMINGMGARGVVHAPALCERAIDLLEA